MKILTILKRLFCHHDYFYFKSLIKEVHEDDFSGDGYNTWKEYYQVYKCKKCGKTKKEFVRYGD